MLLLWNNKILSSSDYVEYIFAVNVLLQNNQNNTHTCKQFKLLSNVGMEDYGICWKFCKQKTKM